MTAQQKSTVPGTLTLDLVFELHVEVGSPIEIGQVNGGTRRIVPILGGSFMGSGLTGKLLPGGNDYQILYADGFTELDARYVLETDGGQLIYVSNRGMRQAPSNIIQKLNAGEPVDPSLVYFRTVPTFETAAEELQWLTRSVFVCVGERYPSQVVVRFYRVP